jgi:hypothetical protein
MSLQAGDRIDKLQLPERQMRIAGQALVKSITIGMMMLG